MAGECNDNTNTAGQAKVGNLELESRRHQHVARRQITMDHLRCDVWVVVSSSHRQPHLVLAQIVHAVADLHQRRHLLERRQFKLCLGRPQQQLLRVQRGMMAAEPSTFLRSPNGTSSMTIIHGSSYVHTPMSSSTLLQAVTHAPSHHHRTSGEDRACAALPRETGA